MKKLVFIFLSLFLCVSSFAEDLSFSIRLDGNAHILAYNDLAKIHKMKNNGGLERVSAEQLYDFYDGIYQKYGDNSLMKEQKQKEAENTLIVIHGYVNLVRKSNLDEYIVELQVQRDWSILNVSVVFPKRISPAMINELTQIKKGDYFESLAFTRTSYAYVDVPVWNSNGVYRTEPYGEILK